MDSEEPLRGEGPAARDERGEAGLPVSPPKSRGKVNAAAARNILSKHHDMKHGIHDGVRPLCAPKSDPCTIIDRHPAPDADR